MTSLGVLHDFHTEYVLPEELYNVVFDTDPRALAYCVRVLEQFAKRILWHIDAPETSAKVKKQAQQLLKEIGDDARQDPVLWQLPACIYSTENIGDDVESRRIAEHERMHAYIGVLALLRWNKPVKVQGRTLKVSRSARIVLGLNQLGPNVGVGFSRIAEVNGWSPHNADSYPEEALMRMREIEFAYETKDRKFIKRLKEELAEAVRRASKQYPELGLQAGDFWKAYHRIKAHWGSVRAFVDSFDKVRVS